MGIFQSIRDAISTAREQTVLPANAILIDVRSPGEFSQGRIEGSVNFPVGEITNHIGAHCPDKTTNIVVFCASGMRSSSARNALIQMGYTQVFNGGGIGSLASKLNKRIV